jgi:nuclear cap-binding protein subunit 1
VSPFRYIERVQKELPEQLAPFLPEAPEPQFKYGSADSATRKVLLIEEISKAVRNKMMTLALVAPVVDSITEIRRVTDIGSAVPAIVEEEEESEERLAEQRLEVYFSCVLNVGSKTMSHLRIILQRQLEALEYYVKTPESRGLVLRVASAYWVKSPLMQQCAIGHLLRNRVIEPSTVVDWVFAPEQVELFCRRYVDAAPPRHTPVIKM